MIIDIRTEFCDATALNTGAAGTYTIGNQADLIGLGTGLTIIGDSTNARIGTDDSAYLVIQVDTLATSGGAATAQFQLVSDSVATLDSSPTVHLTTGTFALAALTAGATLFVGQVPSGTYERYLGIRQVTGVAAFTAGKVNAFITDKPETWYPATDNVN